MNLWQLILQAGLKVVAAPFSTGEESQHAFCQKGAECQGEGPAWSCTLIQLLILITTPCVVLYLIVRKADRAIVVPA